MNDTGHSIDQQTPIALPTSQVAFDYGVLDPEMAQDLRNAAIKIHNAHADAVDAMSNVGRSLIFAKDVLLSHGTFTAWVFAEFGMTPRTAQNYMNASRFLDGKAKCISLLPANVIYRLAAPSAPADVVQAVAAAANSGTPLPPAEITDRLDQARAEEKAVQLEIARAERKHQKLTRAEAKERAAKQIADQAAAVEKDRQLLAARESREAARIERVGLAIKTIAKTLTNENLADLSEMMKDPWRFIGYLKPILQAERISRIAPVDAPTVPTEADAPEVDISEFHA